jgi:hypothetical protein
MFSQQKKLTGFKDIPVMHAFAEAYLSHFKKPATYHKVRALGSARCFYEDTAHLPVGSASDYVRNIKRYLGQQGDSGANCYELMRFDPSLPAGTFALHTDEVVEIPETPDVEIVEPPPTKKRGVMSVDDMVAPAAKKSKADRIKELTDQICAIAAEA